MRYRSPSRNESRTYTSSGTITHTSAPATSSHRKRSTASSRRESSAPAATASAAVSAATPARSAPASSDPANSSATAPQTRLRSGRRDASTRAANAAVSGHARIPYSSTWSPAKRVNDRRSPTIPIPPAAGSNASQNGSISTTLATSTSPSQTIAYARRPSLAGSRSQVATASASRP